MRISGEVDGLPLFGALFEQAEALKRALQNKRLVIEDVHEGTGFDKGQVAVLDVLVGQLGRVPAGLGRGCIIGTGA
mgnify:CR=1 FL=1